MFWVRFSGEVKFLKCLSDGRATAQFEIWPTIDFITNCTMQ